MTDVASGQETLAFGLIGGEACVRELVDRFYDPVDLEPKLAVLRALHPQGLDESRDKLFWLLCGRLNGLNRFIERLGHPRPRVRHAPFKISAQERD